LEESDSGMAIMANKWDGDSDDVSLASDNKDILKVLHYIFWQE
jgi:hypothetical protein